MNQIEKMPLSVVKIGGNVVDNPEVLKSFLSDFNKLEGYKLLVHGGGVMASKMSKQLGIETTMIDGRRVTDAETLKMVTMVYAGWINKNIVASLQQIGCNAIGLSGADANTIPARKRSPIPVDYGYVGDPDSEKVNISIIEQLIKNNLTPVFCAITHDGNGNLLNTNADTIAYVLATGLSEIFKTTIYYCFEKEGVLKDINNPDSLISEMNKNNFETLKDEGIISDGMIPKLFNSFKAIENGVSEVMILHAQNLLIGKGTRLV